MQSSGSLKFAQSERQRIQRPYRAEGLAAIAALTARPHQGRDQHFRPALPTLDVNGRSRIFHKRGTASAQPVAKTGSVWAEGRRTIESGSRPV